MKIQLHNLPKQVLSLALLATLSVLATGCMSFRGDQLARLNPSAKAPAPVVKMVQLDLRVCTDGRPIQGAGAQSVLDWHKKIALHSVAQSGLFGDVDMAEPGTICKPGEYVLKYEINNWGNKAAAVGSGFICGFTLCAFPGFATDHYTVQAEVLDSQGKICWREKYDDKLTTVIWIGFFPCLFVPPCYPMHVLEAEMINIYQHSFQDMLGNKAFLIQQAPVSGTP